MSNNLVKFVYVPTTATAEQIAAFDSNTLYFINGTRQLYKGSVLYDGGAAAAAADLATLRAQIGTLPVDATYTDLIDYIDKQIAAGDAAVEADLETLDESLATVAKSGAAADVSVADSGNHLTSTTVEDALEELAIAVDDAQTAGAVTIESAAGTGDNLTIYSLYQGVTQTDSAAQKAAKKIGDINIPKDYLVRSATIEVVATADTPYTGAAVGDKYIDFTVNTKDGDGTGTATHIYIALNDLVAVMEGSTGSEITVSIDDHNAISATVNKISGSKVIYAEASGTAAEVTVNDKLTALEQAIGDGIDALDGSATIATQTNGVVTLKGGITEEDGVVSNSSAADITLAKVATTGSSIDVSYGSSTVKAALDTIGTIPAGATATTVVGYVDEKATGLIADLDADLDATTSNTDQYAVAVVSGVTQVDGELTSVDSAAADRAGAASAVKAAVIGTNADAAAADTIYGAKAYTDAALTWGSLA